MKIAIAGHCWISSEAQKRNRGIAAVAAEYGVTEISVIIPTAWNELLGSRGVDDQQVEEEVGGIIYRTIPLKIRFPGRIGAYHFIGLRRVLEGLKPDLIHLDAEPYSFAAAQTERLRRSLKIPEFTLYSCDNMPISLRGINRAIEKRVLPNIDGLAAMSSEGAEFYRAKAFAGPIQVVPIMGVDHESFAPIEKGDARAMTGLDEQIMRDETIIGFFGRLVPEKGLRMLLEAFAGAQAEAPSKLLLLGRGPLRDELDARAKHLGIAERVIFRDAVGHDEVPKWLAAIDGLVLPSEELPGRWKEQFGHILIEAMSCGTAAIGSDSGAIPEVIGEAGLVFPEGDADALRQRLVEIVVDEKARRRLADAGRRRVIEQFTHEQVARTMLSFWSDVAGRSKLDSLTRELASDSFLGRGYSPRRSKPTS